MKVKLGNVLVIIGAFLSLCFGTKPQIGGRIANLRFASNNIWTGASTNRIIYVDGTKYPFTATGLSAALTAAREFSPTGIVLFVAANRYFFHDYDPIWSELALHKQWRHQASQRRESPVDDRHAIRNEHEFVWLHD